MPAAPKRPCSVPRCPEWAVRKGRCLPHAQQAQRTYDDFRKPDRPFYWSPEWRRLRRQVLDEEPCCRLCALERRVSVSVEVDHIIPIREGGAALDRGNLQGLCRACHVKKTRAEETARRKANA